MSETSGRTVAAALIHHPILGRDGQVLTTTITNLDLHDMARSVRTYGLSTLYVVHPLASQRTLATRILGHWVEGAGGKRIPDRKTALGSVKIVQTLEDALTDLGTDRAEAELWTTAARAPTDEVLPFADARQRLAEDGPPVMIGFGTGWGLAASVHDRANAALEPISARNDTGFNHLSVRSACAIALDRLLG